MTAPSKTPMSMSMFATQADYWKARTDQLEIALAESRAECERLRTQSDSLNTLNLGQIKIIAKLQSDLREAESREREAYERAAKLQGSVNTLESECDQLNDMTIQQRTLIDDLASMCRRLSYSVKRSGNDNLAYQCVELLKKHDLGGSVIRTDALADEGKA